MDIVFSLDEAARANFLQSKMNYFNCTYICVWAYLPQPFNCLLNLDGLYRDDMSEPSSSSGGSGRRFFNEYKQLILSVENNVVPGHAFKNNVSYLELQEFELQTHASVQLQRQFYAAARIKYSVFMGSSNGEIEIGFSDISQVNIGERMKLEIPTFASSMEVKAAELFQFQNPYFSSSMEIKPESSSFLYSLPTNINPLLFTQSASTDPLTPQLQASSSSCCSYKLRESSKWSAFKKYGGDLTPLQDQGRGRSNMVKRCILFYRNLNLMRIRETIRATRPAAAQLLHMLSERRRRDKFNQNFQALRSLLPSPIKKDRATVLATTRDYLTKLKARVSELRQKNQVLEAQLFPAKQQTKDEARISRSSINGRFNIRVSNVADSTTSEKGQCLDLEISNKSEYSMADMAIRVLEFLKKLKNVRVLFINGDSQMEDSSSSLNRLLFRFSIQDDVEWDESAFQEAVERVVSHQPLR